MKKFYVLSLVFGILFGGSEVTSAQTSSLPDVYLSEVAWSGSALSTADEWLEITNRSSETVDLSGWIVDGAATSGGAIQIGADTLIVPSATLLISNYMSGDPKSTLIVAPQLVTTAVSLANSGLTLRLISPDGTVVDTLAFGSSPSAGGSNPFRSAVRLETGELKDSETSMNLSQVTQLGTPGVADIVWLAEDTVSESEVIPPSVYEFVPENPGSEELLPVLEEVPVTTPDQEPVLVLEPEPVITPEETVAPTEEVIAPEPIAEPDPESIPTPAIVTVIDLSNQQYVRLSEMMPDPLDDIEWIEFINPTTEIITLDGMYITDSVGGKTTLVGTLEAGAYHVIQSPKGKLNNDGDAVTLFTTADHAIDSAMYGTEALGAPRKGESIGRIENTWTILVTATPGEANQSNPILEALEESVETPTPEPITETIELEVTVEEPEEDILEEIIAMPEPQTVTIVSIAEKPIVEKGPTKTPPKKKTVNEAVMSGVITAAPGELGKQIAYMEGVQLYMHSAQWPTLERGDFVEATGTLTTSNGEPRLKLKDASGLTVTRHGTVSVQAFRSSMLKAEYTGFEVHFEGIITDRTKKSLQLELDGAHVTVTLPKEVNGLLLAQDALAGNAIIRSGKEGFYLQVLTKEALEIRATDPALTQSQAPTNQKSPKSMAGAGLATGTLGALGYWLRKYLMLA